MKPTSKYQTDKNGIISNPGKFEGEHISTPYAWDIVLNGCQDKTYTNAQGETVDVVLVNPATELYHLTDGIPYAILLWESSQGFVYAIWMTSEAELSQAWQELGA
jgi:hypothetical protein